MKLLRLCLLFFLLQAFSGSLLASSISLQTLEEAQKTINEMRGCPRGKAQIVNEHVKEVPTLQRVVINTSPTDKKRCIITYATLNNSYGQRLEQLLNRLKHTYRGHVLYRIGGWPNMEAGCLNHCDVPYAFKACAFQEAYKLGYQKVLWLDALVEPLKDIMPLFKHIRKKTVLYRYSIYNFGSQVTQEILNDFNLSFDEAKNYSHIATGILGFNFESKDAVQVLQEWHAAVLRRKSFYTNFPEQIPLSIILHKYKLDDRAFGPNLVTISSNDDPNCFFRIDYTRKQQGTP